MFAGFLVACSHTHNCPWRKAVSPRQDQWQSRALVPGRCSSSSSRQLLSRQSMLGSRALRRLPSGSAGIWVCPPAALSESSSHSNSQTSIGRARKLHKGQALPSAAPWDLCHSTVRPHASPGLSMCSTLVQPLGRCRQLLSTPRSRKRQDLLGQPRIPQPEAGHSWPSQQAQHEACTATVRLLHLPLRPHGNLSPGRAIGSGPRGT